MITDILRNAILLLIVAVTFASRSGVAVAQNDCPDRRTISVNGRGEVKAEADLAYVNFAVETAAATAAAAVSQNADLSGKVAAALKAKIGAEDKLTTTRYNLQPRYDQEKRDPSGPQIVGYVASNEVLVETRDVASVGKLIDAATGAGANRVSNLIFTLRDRDPHVRRALDVAGKEAKAQAEAAAQALGVTLKGVVNATTLSAPIFQPRVLEGFARGAMAQASTPVEAGEVTVSAELNVTYEIE